MSDDSVVVAVDQGTSSTKVTVFDARGDAVAVASVPIGQEHPRPGWVQQDASEILDSVRTAVTQATRGLESRVAALALSTQRESAVVWDRATGEPVGPMLGWQDRRTSDAAGQLSAEADRIREITGLPLDPMFSALKFAWLLDEVDPDRQRDLAVGTVDSWLVTRLTCEHRIETGNAARTQLLGLDGTWSPELLELFRIPERVLPRVAASDEPSAPTTDLLAGTRVHGVLGDSHAALYGHGVRSPGGVKVTYGTGSSIMGLAESAASVPAGLAATIAWQHSGSAPQLAFEGNILASGATLAWLSRLLGREVSELATLARDVPADHGVTLVPAVAGLGAPHWDPNARAVIHGFDLGTTPAVLARAAMEAIANQIEDVLATADAATGTHITTILADGAPSADAHLMQLQADTSQRDVRRPGRPGLSAFGAAQLAAESIGLQFQPDTAATTFTPHLDAEGARRHRAAWHHAVSLARTTPPATSHPTTAATSEGAHS